MKRLTSQRRLVVMALLSAATLFMTATRSGDAVVSANSSPDPLDAALFDRVEFFGSEAILPVPDAVARGNLAELAAQFPERTDIAEKLAETDEKLGRFAD